MSNLRLRTIMAGEVALTQLALRQGLSVRALLDPDQLLKLFLQMPSEELLKVARQLVLRSEADKKTLVHWLSLATVGDQWREDFVNWTARELSTSREHFISATFVEVAVRLCGLGFLKKSDDPRFHLARQALLNSIKTNRIQPLDPIVSDEVQASVTSWSMSKRCGLAFEKPLSGLPIHDSNHDVHQMTRSGKK